MGTEPFRLAAVTWDDGPSDAAVMIRARNRQTGEWSDWFEVHDDGIDPSCPASDRRQLDIVRSVVGRPRLPLRTAR